MNQEQEYNPNPEVQSEPERRGFANPNPGQSERQRPYADPARPRQTYGDYGQGPQQQQQQAPPPYGQYGQPPYGHQQPPQEVQSKARTASILLRIGGWMNIVSGVLSILGIILLVFASSVFFNMFAEEIANEAAMAAGITTFLLVIIGLFLAIGGAVNLWFGISAVKHHADNQKVQFLFVAGIIQAVFAVLGIIGTRSFTGFFGIVAAGTYLAGAIMERQVYRPY